MEEFFTNEKVQDVDIIRFSFNEISLAQREVLKKGLEEILNAGGKKFIIDLTKVGFVSSLVIAIIVFFSKEVKKNDGRLKLSGLSSEAFSVFQLTQLDKVFELYETEHDAIESFKEPA